MAVAQNHLTTAGSGTDTTSYNTASITPSSNNLVLAWVVSKVSSGRADVPSLSGNGLTWVLVSTVEDASGEYRLSVLRAMGASPSSGAVTISFGAQEQDAASWSIVEYSDVNTSGTNGSGAIANKSANISASATSLVLTFTPFSDSDDSVAAGFFHDNDEATTVGGGLSASGSTSQSTPDISLATGFVAGNDTSVSASWTTLSSALGIGVAIRHSASVIVPQVFGVNPTLTAAAGAVTPPIPPGTIAGDLMIMLCETVNQAITVSGWTEAADSPQAPSSNTTRLTIFYRYATTNDLTDASTTSDSGTHNFAAIFSVINSIGTGSPFNVTAGGVDNSADTSGAIPGDTTTVDNTLVIAAVARGEDFATNEFDSWTNTDLTTVTEIMDLTTTLGDGGGFGAAMGWKFAQGSYTTTDVTLANAGTKGMWSGAILPIETGGGGGTTVKDLISSGIIAFPR